MLWLRAGLLLFALGRARAVEGDVDLEKQANDSLIWGTYRPGLYFGLKPRVPASLLTGIAWFGAHDYESYKRASLLVGARTRRKLTGEQKPGLRHECDTGDGFKTYTYTEHDGRTYAKQLIEDSSNNVRLVISWLNIPGGTHGEQLHFGRGAQC